MHDTSPQWYFVPIYNFLSDYMKQLCHIFHCHAWSSCILLMSSFWNGIILVIEYHHPNTIMAYQKLQNQKHLSLLKKPYENRVGTKLEDKTELCAKYSIR